MKLISFSELEKLNMMSGLDKFKPAIKKSFEEIYNEQALGVFTL